eukprot:scaffold2353_cov73-Skeletonema_marinoi.AAC.7
MIDTGGVDYCAISKRAIAQIVTGVANASNKLSIECPGVANISCASVLFISGVLACVVIDITVDNTNNRDDRI